MLFEKITESESLYQDLEKMSVTNLLVNINIEDQKVAAAVQKEIASIKVVVEMVVEKMKAGGRLFYIGAGTSGRLGILDASECVPTFGIAPGLIIGIIAGGEKAITNAVEFAEDDTEQGWKDLEHYQVCTKDIVIGITASGSTPYVIAALKKCKEINIATVAICCNKFAPVSQIASHLIEVIVGPEFITGSTRMKSGTAQKLVLNMISSSAMILQGYVQNNSMVNMELTNQKLIDRAVKMVMEKFKLTDYEKAKMLLFKAGGLKGIFGKI